MYELLVELLVATALVDKSVLQLQQLGLPFGFRSRVYWLDSIYLTNTYETKHTRGDHYAQKEHH